MKEKIAHILQISWVQHLLFWSISYYVLLRFFAYRSEVFISDYIYTGLFHISLLLVVYGNLKVLIPLFLQKNKLVLYIASIVLLLWIGIQVNLFTFNYLSDVFFPKFFFISYYEFWELAYFFLIYWGLTTLLKFSKAWFVVTETRQKLQALQTAKLSAELEGLKSQVNPHFLFNALNSIYALAIDNKVQTPIAILKLSEVLRYMIYESNEKRVLLRKEIKSITDYIEIQQLRLEKGVDLKFDVIGAIENQQIAPLLLIPFVENGFKHGLKGAIQDSFFHIRLEAAEHYIQFRAKNNQGEIDEIEGSKGIGLENVRKRLSLIYPDKHTLIIRNEPDYFEVHLMIEI